MDVERIESIVKEVTLLVGDESLARPFRDFLLLFLGRLKFDDFEEHRLFLERLLKEGRVDPEGLVAGILLSLCGLASEQKLPLGEVKEILDILLHRGMSFTEDFALDKRRNGEAAGASLPFGLAYLDSDGRVVRANRAFREASGGKESLASIFPSASLREGRLHSKRFDGKSFELILKPYNDGYILLLLQEEDEKREPFNELLRRLRKERGYTLVALAEELGISRGYLHNIEGGRVVPAYGLIERIASLLDPEGREGLFLSGVVARIPPECRAQLLRLL